MKKGRCAPVTLRKTWQPAWTGSFLLGGVVGLMLMATPAHAVARGKRRPFAVPRAPLAALPLAGAATGIDATMASGQESVQRPQCSAPRNLLAYHGGALVQNPDVFLLFWGAQWDSDAAHIAAKNALTAMYQQLGTSGYACAWREYGVASQPLGAGTFNGSYVIPSAPPNPVSDAAIRNRISTEVGLGHAPARSDDRVYVVVTPKNVAVNAGGETGCGGANFTFCGYHDDFTSGGAFRYAVLPYPCSTLEGTCFVDAAQSVSAAFEVVGSHELTEVVTDPDSNPGGWYSDHSGDENADICAGDACVDQLAVGPQTFAVNPAWSNLAKGCVTSVPCPPAPVGCTDPTPGACAPGNGKQRGCALEWQVDPNLTFRRHTGLPTNRVTCTDGQTLCDFDAARDGQCTFHVALCLNSQDPRLPLCSPVAIDGIELRRPTLADPLALPLLTALRDADAGGTLNGSTVSYVPAATNVNECTGYLNVGVPAGERRKISLSLQTDVGPARSGVTLTCKP